MHIDSKERAVYDLAMESRITRLVAAMEHMQRDIAELKADVRSIRTTDFRIMFGALITVALGLATIMAKGFGWL